MAVILDTSVLIAAERARDSARLAQLIAKIPAVPGHDEVLISVITASELLMGIHRGTNEARSAARQRFVDGILDQFSFIPIDLRIAREHSRMVAPLLARGEPIGAHDAWIAATALTYGHSIATANVREFSRVDGLTVIDIAS